MAPVAVVVAVAASPVVVRLDIRSGHDANVVRTAFLFVQILDGFGTTDDNVTGKLPGYISDAGFSAVEETHREATILGTISLYRAVAL